MLLGGLVIGGLLFMAGITLLGIVTMVKAGDERQDAESRFQDIDHQLEHGAQLGVLALQGVTLARF